MEEGMTSSYRFQLTYQGHLVSQSKDLSRLLRMKRKIVKEIEKGTPDLWVGGAYIEGSVFEPEKLLIKEISSRE